MTNTSPYLHHGYWKIPFPRKQYASNVHDLTTEYVTKLPAPTSSWTSYISFLHPSLEERARSSVQSGSHEGSRATCINNARGHNCFIQIEIQSDPGCCYLEMAEIELLRKMLALLTCIHTPGPGRVTHLEQWSTLGQQYQSDWSTHHTLD